VKINLVFVEKMVKKIRMNLENVVAPL